MREDKREAERIPEPSIVGTPQKAQAGGSGAGAVVTRDDSRLIALICCAVPVNRSYATPRQL
jgi:hypothetical protein